MRTFGALAAAGAMLLLASPVLAAQQNQLPKPLEITVTVTGHMGVVKGSPSDHFLSFSGPIEIPGVGLKPGTYIFQPVDTGIVRVMSPDRSTVYATFYTTPVTRVTAGATQVTFERTAERAPVRIAAWFPAGQLDGMAPMYPTTHTTRPATGD
jgi:hypothetical protein